MNCQSMRNKPDKTVHGINKHNVDTAGFDLRPNENNTKLIGELNPEGTSDSQVARSGGREKGCGLIETRTLPAEDCPKRDQNR